MKVIEYDARYGGDEFGLCDFLDVVMQEVAVIHGHVGENECLFHDRILLV